ncbi:TRAP transporter small permease [Leucobacter sp. NPDC015123]|uniref:TRAP transporter small permease n=1 Tax=Leucobacter sp. NPDC015123 TaxID=3364129 RepID=UPI0036F4712A
MQSPAARSAPRWLRGTLATVEEWVPAALMGVMAVAITADVIMRYVFNHPLAWAGPLSMFCMVWMVYLGSAAVSRRGAHICLDFLSTKLGHRGRATVDLFVELVTLAVLGTICVATVIYLEKARFLIMPGLGFSKKYITVAALVGLVLMVIHSCGHAVRAIAGLRNPDYERVNVPIEEVELDDFDTRFVNVVSDELTGKQG